MPMFADYFKTIKAIPDSELNERALKHVSIIRVIASECVTIKAHKRLTVYAGQIIPKDSRLRLAGVYDSDRRRILISPPVLEHLGTAIGTGVHEIAHHVSGAEDGDMKHYESMVAVARVTAEVAAAGKLDYLLVGARW